MKKLFFVLALCGLLPGLSGGELADKIKAAAAAGGRIVIDAPEKVSGELTVPANVTLEFHGNGRIELAKNAVLTVDGPVAAGAQTIFAGPGKVTGRVQALQIPVQWFGATADDDIDDTEAIRNAAELARHALGRKLLIPAGRYRISGIIPIRCHVDCYGVLEKFIVCDDARMEVSPSGFTPLYQVNQAARLEIVPDEAPIPLDAAAFGAVQAGTFTIPKFLGVKTLDPARPTIDLAEGGTLRFAGTDFFSSRNNAKGDQYYTPNDYCQLVSPRGDVFPEFCFSFAPPAEAAAWDAARSYRRGDYCTVDGILFKATYPSGPGASYTHPKLGKVEFAPCRPNPKAAETKFAYKYANGMADSICFWLKVETKIEYTPPQAPLTINGLAVEIFDNNAEQKTRPVYDSTLAVNRSNVTFHNLSLSVKDSLILPSVLSSVSNCAAVVFNNCRWSGATQHGLGYNIMHGNAAAITYNNCVSVNARDAIAGRHGKNITVNGGHFGCIDDHYGMNYTIKNVHISSLSTMVPGYLSPAADVSKWKFVPREAIIIGGRGNVTIENCRFFNTKGIFTSRADIGDLGGSVTIRDCYIRSDHDVNIVGIQSHPESGFDYAHTLLTPKKILVDNVVLEGAGQLGLRINHNQGAAFPLTVSNCANLGKIELRNVEASFADCEFVNAEFKTAVTPLVNFRDCVFTGKNTGLTDQLIGRASGNLLRKDASVAWTLNRIDPERFRQ